MTLPSFILLLKGMIKIFKELIIDDIEDLIDTVVEDVNSGDYEVVGIIAKYEEVAFIIKEILQYEETSIGDISLFSEEFTGYDKEYLITLDDNWVVDCEQFYNDDYNRYIFFTTDKTYVLEDCNKNVTAGCDEDSTVVVYYNDSLLDEYEEENDHNNSSDYYIDDNSEVYLWNDSGYFGVNFSYFDDDNNCRLFQYMSKNISDIKELLDFLH